MSKNKPALLVLASPGFGSIDNWLPVMKELKNSHDIEIYLVFSEKSSILTIKTDSELFRFSEMLSDKVLFHTYANEWHLTSSLSIAKRIIDLRKIDKFILKIIRKLIAGRLSKFYFFRTIGKILDALFVLKERIRIALTSESHSLVNNFEEIQNVFAILFDVTVESKIANRNLLQHFNAIPKFSILHGLAAPATHQFNEINSDCQNKLSNRNDVFVYPYSKYEVEWYKDYYSIDKNNIYVSGIIRHDIEWINYVVSNSKLEHSVELFDDFVLIIGRPISPFNPPSRYKLALNNINDLICNELGKKVVIKTHPKEDPDGIESSIYIEVFGKENFGLTWCFSDSHPFLLGQKCYFGISFYSSVPIDLIALGKPTIEYVDLRGLDRYDNDESLRDHDGHPVFPERHAGLVLGASNKEQFKRHVLNILTDYNSTFSKLDHKYKEYFIKQKKITKVVANDISKCIF